MQTSLLKQCVAEFIGPFALISIGLTVTLDILFGGPFTGAAMDVARGLVPMLGGGLAGLIYGRFLIKP